MGFIENVLSLIDKKGITKNKMLKDLGMGTGTFNTWEKRGTIPNGEILSKIAAYFNVSTDYLLGNEQKNKPAENGEPINEKQMLIMEKLKMLTPENYELAIAQLDAILNHQDKQGK